MAHWALSTETFQRIEAQTRYEARPLRAGNRLFDPISAWWCYSLKRHVVPLAWRCREAEVCDPATCRGCAQAARAEFVPHVWWEYWCLEWARVGDAAAHWITTRPQRERQRRLIRLGNAVASMLVQHAASFATFTDGGVSWNGPIVRHDTYMKYKEADVVMQTWYTTPLLPMFRMNVYDQKGYAWGLARQDGTGAYHHDLGTVLTQDGWVDGPWRSAVIKWLWVMRHLLLRPQSVKEEKKQLAQAQDREREEAWLRSVMNVAVPALGEVVSACAPWLIST